MVCVNSVNVYPSEVTLQTGSWYYGAWAEVCPTYAECTDVNWYSDNPSVASVNATSGYIYARSAGSARIYACATDGSGVSDYITVTVTSKVSVTSVTLNRTSLSLEKGDDYALTATVCPENATNQEICWRSTNTSVAEVNSGVVTAKASGYAYIYAEATDGSGKYARCYVHVTEDILVTSVTVKPLNKTLRVGESDFFHATVCPENATDKCVVWVSSNPSVATIISNSGLVFAHSVGQTTIKAAPRDGGADPGEYVLTVEPPIPVEGVQVCPADLTMNVGDTERLCAVICPENATNKRVTWCSSNENVACVDYYTGEITANLAGTATITATTVDGGVRASCDVVVGYSAIVNGKTIAVYGEDDELLDQHTGANPTGLYVYANDMLLTSACEDADGDITVCMGEIVQALCTDSFLNSTLTEWRVSTSHRDLQIFREKTYYTSELGLCPFDNINDRISLAKFVEDMGYGSKYSSISYSDGTKIIFIQGHDWYSAASLSAISAEEFTSLTLSCLPYVGDAKDLAEGITGKDIITGEQLSTFDRVVCIGCTLLPVVNGATVRVGRKGFAKIDNLVRYIDTLPEAKKVVLHSDIWNILRPITRGLCLETAFAESVYRAVDGWIHIGREMNGFFPVIDFIKTGARLQDTIVISMKTLDPRLYKLADGSYNYTRIRNVINTYVGKLKTEKMFIDNVPIVNRQLDLVVPKGYADIINSLDGINKEGIIFNLLEV